MSSRKYKTLSKNVALFTVSNIGTKIFSFLLLPVITMYVSTKDYGTFDIIVTSVGLFVSFFTLNIQDAVLRFCMDEKCKNPRTVLSVALKINAISDFLAAAVLTLVKMTGVLKLSTPFCIFFYVNFFALSLTNSLQMYLKARDKVAVLTWASIAGTFVTAVLTLLSLSVFKWGTDGYLFSYGAGYIVTVLIMLLFGGILTEKHEKADLSLVKEMLIFCSPLVINTASWWINDASDRYILTYFGGLAVNGIYSIAHKIPTVFVTFQTVVYNAWSISAISEFDEYDSDGFFGNTYSAYSTVSVLAASLLIAFNRPLARLLFTGEYFPAWHYVPILIAATLFNGLSLFQSCIFIALKDSKTITLTALLGAAVNVVLNFWFIPRYSCFGAAYATLAGYSVIFILRIFLLRKHIKMRVNWVVQGICYLLLVLQAVVSTTMGYGLVPYFFALAIFLINIPIINRVVLLLNKRIRKKGKRER